MVRPFDKRQGLVGVAVLGAAMLCAARGQGQPAAGGAGLGPRTSGSVVQATASAEKPGADGTQVVTVRLTMSKDKPWHLYGNPLPKEFPGVPTTVTVDARIKADDVKVAYPQGKVVKDADYGDHQVYEKQVDIKVTVRRPKGDTGSLQLKAKFQACYEINEKGKVDGRCLPPSTVSLSVP